MTYTPVVYDWRYSVQPKDQVFRAGGNSISGGMTIGGASVVNPEPGGRAELFMEFDQLAIDGSNLDASWLISRMLNGNIFRVRLFAPSVQLVAADDLGGVDDGVMWDNDLPWDNGYGWAFDPTAPVAIGGAKGDTSVKVNMSDYGQVLQIGHVIGFHVDGYDFAHVVTDISYTAADRATITVNPPLRRRVAADDVMYLRPTMTCTCVNAREVMGSFRRGLVMDLAPMRFVEALI